MIIQQDIFSFFTNLLDISFVHERLELRLINPPANPYTIKKM